MKLLLTGCFSYTAEQKNGIKALGYDIYFMQHESGTLPLPAENIETVVCNGLFLHHNIDNFKNLKFIQLTSAGFDRVPVDKIKQRGIILRNARGVYSIPMAEWALFRVLEHYKQGWFFKAEQDMGSWTKHRGLRELKEVKVAVIGAGNVGQEVAKRFHAFDAKVTGFDIHTNKVQYFDDILLTDNFNEHVGEFDIVVVTAPLLPSTHHLLSKDILLNLKENAILVNIARGALIDEKALCDVLKARSDLFAALDVFESEPLPSDNPLWKLNNVSISPHNSFVSDGNNRRMFSVIYENLRQLNLGQ